MSGKCNREANRGKYLSVFVPLGMPGAGSALSLPDADQSLGDPFAGEHLCGWLRKG